MVVLTDEETWNALVKDTKDRIEKVKKRLKKLKHYRCIECGKEYTTQGWCHFHKKRKNHTRFKEINMELKKQENE